MFNEIIVFVVLDDVMTSLFPPNIIAQKAPGRRKIALGKAPALLSGMSFMVDMMSIRREE